MASIGLDELGVSLQVDEDDCGCGEDLSKARNPRSPTRKKRHRTKFSPEQVAAFRGLYEVNDHPSRAEVVELSNRLGIDYAIVKQWFDNRRYNDRHRPSRKQQEERGLNSGLSPDDDEEEPSGGDDVFRRCGPADRKRKSFTREENDCPENSDTSNRAVKMELMRQLGLEEDVRVKSDEDKHSDAPNISSSAKVSSSQVHTQQVTALAVDTTSIPRFNSPSGNRGILARLESKSAKCRCSSPLLSRPVPSTVRPQPLVWSSTLGWTTRPVREPMEYWEEANEVLHALPRNTAYDKKDYVATLLPQFLSLIERRKELYGEKDYEGFCAEVERLFQGLIFVNEANLLQGDRKMRSNVFKVGSFCLPIRASATSGASSADNHQSELLEVYYLHESKVEGAPETGRQVATERLVLTVFPDNDSQMTQVGVKAKGSAQSLSPVCSCRSRLHHNQINRVHNQPDPSSSYWAWGNLERLRQALATCLTASELMSFLVFCVAPSLHGAHWLNIAMLHHFFPPGTPHYYEVVETTS